MDLIFNRFPDCTRNEIALTDFHYQKRATQEAKTSSLLVFEVQWPQTTSRGFVGPSFCSATSQRQANVQRFKKRPALEGLNGQDFALCTALRFPKLAWSSMQLLSFYWPSPRSSSACNATDWERAELSAEAASFGNFYRWYWLHPRLYYK